MDTKTISLLREWAKTYNTESFIKDDPVRFPHRFTEKRDIEISAFLTAWISYGRRAHILQKAEELHRLMGESPYELSVPERLLSLPYGTARFAGGIPFTVFIPIMICISFVVA